MPDDWKPGDLALCVRKPDVQWGWSPAVGGVYTVTDSGVGWEADGSPGIWLDFAEDPMPDEESGYEADAFRKIHPLSIEERNSEIRLLTGKPVKEPA